MKYVNESKIYGALERAKKAPRKRLDQVLEKAKALKRLTVEETALLLSFSGPDDLHKIQEAASYVKRSIYGTRVVLFAPLYISNICSNYCAYCAFKADNQNIFRKKLTMDEIADETKTLLKMGHKRLLVVAGESAGEEEQDVEYYVSSINTIYSQQYGASRIRRVNINAAPLSVAGFMRLKRAGIGTYQIFQETYHEKTYREVHPRGPKSDPDNRIDAVARAFEAGIDDVGMGVLYGLYDHRFETLALLQHIEELEKKFGVGPHTISIPRIEPAVGSAFSEHPPYIVSDEDFKKLVAILRLAVPYTGIILSTRETPELRDELFNLGVSQISAASITAPGGYAASVNNEAGNGQFSVHDMRSLDEIVGSLLDKNAMPSFCTACYREERTGKAFMDLAKPGMIKGKCRMNALLTLKEYLDDFASPEVREKGYRLIKEVERTLGEDEKKSLSVFFNDMDKGARDEHV